MKNAIFVCLTLALVMTASVAFGFGGYGTDVNNACAPLAPYTGDCTLCHLNDRGAPTPAKSAYSAGGATLTDYFCPVPAPVDADNDNYAVPDDCNDTNASINPGATEICGNGVDEDCSGADLSCPVDPTPTPVTDEDGDGFNAIAFGGNDCDDTLASVNPNAAEVCNDSVDNNCDGLIDGMDSNKCPAPSTCTDADVDGFFAQADCTTAQDCNDSEGTTFPGAEELCGDGIDNDCDGSVDENCDIANADGATIYETSCASCHGDLPGSDVCGDDAKDIREAIREERRMSGLSSLTDEQVKMIEDALSSCNNDSDDDSDDDKARGKDRGKDRDKDRDRDSSYEDSNDGHSRDRIFHRESKRKHD